MILKLDINKEAIEEEETYELTHYELTLIPENEQDEEKFEELEEDFYFEIFFSKDKETDKKNLTILF